MALPMAEILLATLIAVGMALACGTLAAKLGFPLPAPGRRLGCVDGLRGFLAIFVMVSHFIIWLKIRQLGGGWEPPAVNLFHNFGQGAVALFFMTTGFLFYPRILGGFSRLDLRATYASRVFRIYPLLLASFALILLVIGLRAGFAFEGGWSSQLRPVLMWLFCYSQPPLLGYAESGWLNAFVLWTLWYEWMFYLFVLPGLAWLRSLTWAWLPSFCIPVAVCILAPLLAQILPRPTILPYLPAFALGMLAYELRSRSAVAAWLATPAAAAVGCMAVATAAIGTWLPYAFPQLLAYGFLFACVACGNSLFGMLARPGALVLGECSFGIYLLHGFVLDVFFVDVLPLPHAIGPLMMPWLLPLLTAAVLLFAMAGFLLIERPGMQAGRQVAQFLTSRAPPVMRSAESAP